MDSDQPAHSIPSRMENSLRPHLIALHGPDECGKDTIAEIIREQIEGSQMTILIKAFADRVKIAIGAVFGVEAHIAIDWYDKVKLGAVVAECQPSAYGRYLTGRQFIEHFAESHKALFGEDFWVKQVLPVDRVEFLRLWTLPEQEQVPDFALITDLRYEIEYEYLEGLGGEVWGVEGRGVQGNAHEIQPKYVIDNSGSIDDLRPQISTLLASP